MSRSPGFDVCAVRGFHLTFANGYTVSVQIGAGSYTENYDADFDEFRDKRKVESMDAECAVFKDDGELIYHPLFDGSSVGSYMTPAQVLELMNWAASQP